MPGYPSIVFPSIDDWANYLDTEVVTNGMQLITGLIGNNAINGAVTFIRKSPLNWSKAALYSTGGDVGITDNFQGVAIFTGTAPSSITWTDNFYHQYMFINMTTKDIPVKTPLVYYGLSGNPIDIIPANSAVSIFKATNDLWVQAMLTYSSSIGKKPDTYVVGTTPGAPVAGTSTWTNVDFKGSYVVLVLSRSIIVDLRDVGDGSPFITKLLPSDTLTISNYQWQTGDVLTYILIAVTGNQTSQPNLVPYFLTEDTVITALGPAPENTTVTVMIQPNGFNYTWDPSFVFTDTWNPQAGATGAGTTQVYVFKYLNGAWRCTDQSITL